MLYIGFHQGYRETSITFLFCSFKLWLTPFSCKRPLALLPPLYHEPPALEWPGPHCHGCCGSGRSRNRERIHSDAQHGETLLLLSARMPRQDMPNRRKVAYNHYLQYWEAAAAWRGGYKPSLKLRSLGLNMDIAKSHLNHNELSSNFPLTINISFLLLFGLQI